MPVESPGQAALEREFLPIRAKILEIAASLDRIERCEGEEMADARWQQLQKAIALLLEKQGNRAGQVQLLFSRTYESDWREAFQIG